MVCKGKPSAFADILAGGWPVGADDVRMLRDKRSNNGKLQASRQLAWAPDRGRIGDFWLAESPDMARGGIEVCKRTVAGQQ
jgi:hypothetical protein